MIRTILLIAGFLAVPQWTVPLHVPRVASLSCSGSDTFSGSGALSGCWTSPNTPWSLGNTVATLQRSGGLLTTAGGAFSDGAALYTGGTIPANAYAQITVTALPAPENFFLCVRGDASGNGYCYNQSTGYIQKITAGSQAALVGACGGATVGHTYKLDANGTTITLTDVTTSTTLCSGTDSTWTSGFPVVIIDLGGGGSGGTSGVELSNFTTGTP